MTTKAELNAAQARASEEKALAKQRLAELKASLKPVAVLKRWGRRAESSVSAAVRTTGDAVGAHPALAVSGLTGLGLLAAAKPLGGVIAAKLRPRGRDARSGGRRD